MSTIITGAVGQYSNKVKAESIQEKIFNFLYKDVVNNLKEINKNEKSKFEKTIKYALIASITGSVGALVFPTFSIPSGILTTFLAFKATTSFVHKLSESKLKNSQKNQIKEKKNENEEGSYRGLFESFTNFIKNFGEDALYILKSSVEFLYSNLCSNEYDLESFKKMIKNSCEKRISDKEKNDNSQEKINRDLYLAHGLDYKKSKSVNNELTTEPDKRFLLDLFKKYKMKYDEESKESRRDFNIALEQLEILFASGRMQDDAFFNIYSCTLDYEGTNNINERNKIDNEKPSENNVVEDFSKKGVIALLSNWSKDNKLVKEDLKTKIEELYRIVSDKYDGWCKKYEEIEKLYKGKDRKVGIFNAPEEGFLKQKFKEFTMAFYDFDHLLKIFKNPEEYPLLVGEFRGTLKDSSIEYTKHFDKLILTVLETNKKESVSHERKNYFNLIKNIKKINEDEEIKSKICSDLKNFKEYFKKKCDSFNMRYPDFLKTIDYAVSFLSLSNMEELDKFTIEKYSEKDIKELLDNNLNNSENKIILDLIMEDINKPAYRALNYHMNEYSLTQKQISDLYEKKSNPKTVLSLLEDEHHPKINVLDTGKFLIWCRDNADSDLIEKVKKIYESGDEKKLYNEESKYKKYHKQQNLTKEDLIKLFKNKESLYHEDFDDLSKSFIINPFKEGNFLGIVLQIIRNGENFNIKKDELKKIFPYEEDTVKLENQIIRNFLKWCKKHTTKDYYQNLRKTYLKRAFGIEETSYRRENLRYILKDKSEEDLQSLIEFFQEEINSEYSIDENLYYEIRVLKEERRLGLTSGKYSKDNLLRLLDNRYTFPHLWQEVVKPIKEHISNKHKGETSFLIEIKTDGVITKLKDWLKNGGIDEEDFDLEYETSNLLWEIIGKLANKKFILDINNRLNQLQNERKNIGVKEHSKYTKEQFLTILNNEKKYPILYSRIKRFSEKVFNKQNNINIEFSQIKDKICPILEGKEKIKQRGQYIENIKKIVERFIEENTENKEKTNNKLNKKIDKKTLNRVEVELKEFSKYRDTKDN